MTQTQGLRVQDLHKAFGARQVLRGINFEVRPGEIFGFVGANGAGKTTTMRIAMGIYDADSGSVTLGGNTIGAAERTSIGYMPEERGLYPKMKVGEQLTYLAELHGLSSSAARAAAEKWTKRLGVFERWNDPVEKLSLGNQQRVQLASALVFNPTALILDEPFSGLDPVAVDVMSSVLVEQAARGIPVIFSSHQLDLVERLCDRVGVLAGGVLVANGSIPEIRVAATTPQTEFIVDSAAAVAVREYAQQAGITLNKETTADGQVTLVAALGCDTEEAQQLAAAALTAGKLHTFAPLQPPLTELYRDIITPASAQAAQADTIAK